MCSTYDVNINYYKAWKAGRKLWYLFKVQVKHLLNCCPHILLLWRSPILVYFFSFKILVCIFLCLIYIFLWQIYLSFPFIAWSVVDYEIDDDNQFRYMLMSYGSSIEGWRQCRLVISVDGTYLSTKFKRTLFIACSIDGNIHSFPLAFGTEDTNNDNSWSDFFRGWGVQLELEEIWLLFPIGIIVLKMLYLLFIQKLSISCIEEFKNLYEI